MPTNRPIRVAFLVPDDRLERPFPRPYFGTAPTALLEGFEQMGPELIEAHVISCREGDMPAPEKLAANIWYHQICLPHWRFLRSLHSGPILGVRKLLRAIRPDIVHSQGTERWCAISGVFSGHPRVLTIHGHLTLIDKVVKMQPRHYWKLQLLLGEFAIPRHDGVICISRHVQHAVAGAAKKTWHVPNALRSAFFSPRKNGAQAKVPTLLIIGTITENKRQLEILRLLLRMFGQGIAFEAVFLGDLGDFGDYQAQFRGEIAQAEKLGFARFCGRLAINELVERMDTAHALVHCPMEEAFGLVVAEALARGLKLFASRVGGIVDIARDVPGAELFDVNDWSALELSLKNWIVGGSPGLPAAPAIMSERYSPAAISRRHLEIYGEALAGRKAGVSP